MTTLDKAILKMAKLANGANKNKAVFTVGEDIYQAFKDKYSTSDLSFLGIPIKQGTFTENGVIEIKGGLQF